MSRERDPAAADPSRGRGGVLRWLMLRLLMVALASLVAVGVAEGILRAGIAMKVPFLRDPRLYAGWLDDDDQWKLRHRWQVAREMTEAGYEIDPLLGWIPQRSDDNPHGATAHRVAPPSHRPSVVCVGDSFMAGVRPVRVRDRIPQQLNRLFRGRQVYNYAVSGYGVGQILLRACDMLEHYPRATVVAGIMMLDLDRSMFSVRDAPKPRFEVTDERLRLTNTPLPPDPATWYRDHPPDLNSYLASLVKHQLRLLAVDRREDLLEDKRAAKEDLNRRLIEALVAETSARGSQLLMVLFYPAWQLSAENWRERFLKETLDELGVAYVDTKAVFAALGDDAAERYFLPAPNNHPNVEGNRVIAEAIRDALLLVERTPLAVVDETALACPAR